MPAPVNPAKNAGRSSGNTGWSTAESAFRARTMAPRVALPEIPEVERPPLAEQFKADVVLVNPPSPNKDPYIRDVHRVGRNSREGTIWPQTALAQLAAMFPTVMDVRVLDCIGEGMGWARFEQWLLEARPRYYITHVTAPTMTNDMRGVFLAKALGATTIAIGTHVSPAATETLRAFPDLDYVLRGEPEVTMVALIAALEAHAGTGSAPWAAEMVQRWEPLLREGETGWPPPWVANVYSAVRSAPTSPSPVCSERVSASQACSGRVSVYPTGVLNRTVLASIRGLAWRDGGEVVINAERPFVADLDALPIPRHELLPLHRYKLPLVGGRYTFIVTSRGCPGGCIFCIKHVTYQNTLRLRSPAHILQEVRKLIELGTHNIHFEADLFTANREQVVGLCQAILAEKVPVRWTCNSRVDFVDEELLPLMARAGCWMISWGIESGSEAILKRAHKGIDLPRVEQALRWSKAAGIRNWGYFIIGLPGETEETINQTIAFSKKLPLDLALFHIAVPYPGTPFWYEALAEGWLRLQRWEDLDMYNSTVVEYPNLTSEQLQQAARRAAREWSLRPGPIWTFLKEMRHRETLDQLLHIGVRYLGWIAGRDQG